MLSPNLLKAYTNVMIAVEAAKHGVTGGGDTVSGLMFADDFVGMSETSEGETSTERTRVTAHVKKCCSSSYVTKIR